MKERQPGPLSNGGIGTSTLRAASAVFAVVVLAAGAPQKGKRLNQLCPYVGGTLVEHAARTALASGAAEVIVVVGDYAEEIRRRLRRLPVRVVVNRDWKEGISSSIRCGISKLRSEPDAAVLYLCDQPHVTPRHLSSLAKRVLTADGPPIVASSYDGVLGAPSAFAGSIFPRLLELTGPAGARQIIRSADVWVECLSCPEAQFEIVWALSPQVLGFCIETDPLWHCICAGDPRSPPNKHENPTAA